MGHNTSLSLQKRILKHSNTPEKSINNNSMHIKTDQSNKFISFDVQDRQTRNRSIMNQEIKNAYGTNAVNEDNAPVTARM